MDTPPSSGEACVLPFACARWKHCISRRALRGSGVCGGSGARTVEKVVDDVKHLKADIKAESLGGVSVAFPFRLAAS